MGDELDRAHSPVSACTTLRHVPHGTASRDAAGCLFILASPNSEIPRRPRTGPGCEWIATGAILMAASKGLRVVQVCDGAARDVG